MMPATSVRATLSRTLRHLLPVALAFATATCTQDNTGPSDTGRGYFSFRPVYQLAGGASLSQFGIVADTVRVRITRPVDQLVIDTAVAFPADSSSLSLALPITLLSSPELLDAVVTITAQGAVIFVDSLQVEAVDGPPGSSTPPTIVFEYVGPGSNIALIDLTPADTTITFGDTVYFGATAEDSAQAPVSNFYVSWTSTAPLVAKANGAGQVVAGIARGTAKIIGTTPTGIADTSTITVAPAPAIITADSGNAQVAPAGDSLPALFVARVKAADSLGVAGIPVRFAAVLGNGTIRDTLLYTDVNGRVRTRAVFDTAAGAYSWTATAVGTGLPAATFTATATAGAPVAIAIVGGNTQVDTIAQALPAPFVVRITDAFGNPVAGTGVLFTRTTGTGTLADDTVFTNGSGLASVGYTLGNTVGTDSVQALLVGSSAFVTFTTTSVADGPAVIQEFDGSGQSAMVNTAFPESLLVRVFDAHDNPVPGATVIWSIFSGQGLLLFDTTVTDGTGSTRNGLIAGTLAGQLQVEARPAALANGITLTNTVTAGPAMALTIGAGDGQTAPASSPVAIAPTVHVVDAFGNVVAGDTIAFAVTIGGGSVDSAIATTDSAGNANAGTWTLGAGTGLQQVRATSAAVPSDTLLFDATALPAGTSKAWTGAASALWTDGGNWSPAGAPTSSDNVFIPAGATSPTVTTFEQVGDLAIESGAQLTLGAVVFSVNGNATLDGTVAGTGNLNLIGTGRTLRGNATVNNVTVNGTYTLAGPTTLDGRLEIAGVLTIGGQTLVVDSTFRTSLNGQLVMTNAADSVDVSRDITFNGNVTSGTLTNGILVARGGFFQSSGAADNFVAAAPHRVRFAGSATQIVQFSDPGTSRFGNVEFNNAAGVDVISNVAVAGSAVVLQGLVGDFGTTAIIGGNLASASANWSFGTTNFTGTPILFPDTITGNVMFQNGATLTDPFTVGGSLTVFSGLLDVNGQSLTVGTSLQLTGTGQLHMASPTDSVDVNGFGMNTSTSGAGHYVTGVLIVRDGNFVDAGSPGSFYATGSHVTRFAGTGPQTMFFTNPDTGASRFYRLEITNPTTVTANSNIAAVGPIVINDGVMLGAGRTAFLGGGGIQDTAGGRWNIGTTVFQENPATLPIGLPGNVVWRASGSLSASLTVGGSFTIDEDTLYLAARALQVAGDLTVGGSGVLPMVTPNDTLIVLGNVTWSTTASHAGWLTAGHFLFQKNFTQVGSTPDNFAADTGLHAFIATAGTAPQLSFADPVASHFGTLAVSSVNGVNLATDVAVVGEFSEGNGTPLTIFSGLQHTLRVGATDVDGMIFDRVNVAVNSKVNALAFDQVTFVNQDPSVIQLSLAFPGLAGDTIRLDGVSFDGTPTTGQYVFATDSVANDGVANIAFYNSAPLNGSAYTTVDGSVGDQPNVLWSHLEWQVEPTVATEGVALTPFPEVRAVDPSGVVMAGYTNTITLSLGIDPSGGAAVLGGNTADPSNGVATFDALTISVAGSPYTLRPSSPELGFGPESSPFTVDLPIPVGTTTAFNNGGGDNDWNNAANWTGGLPDSTDNVFVMPGQTATVNTPSRANTVIIGSGGTILLNADLVVDSTVTAGTTITGGGHLIAQGTGYLSGQVGSLIVTGDYTVPSSDPLTAQSIVITGATAVLNPGQGQITAFDSLRTEAGGRLNIGYPGASVDIDGLARFTGGASALTDGTLYIGGDFSQEENAGAFAPSAGFQTVFDGGGTQHATFFTPDSIGDHFAHLRMENGGTLHLQGFVPILGDLDLSGGTVVVDSVTFIAGNVSGSTGAFLQGNTLQVAGDLGLGGVYTMAQTVFVGTGQTIHPLSSGYDTLSVMGTALLGGNITANAAYVFGDGQMSMGGRRMDVVGDFGTFGNGMFGMQDAADSLMVGGSFYASGGPTTGLLTAGLLQVGGNFIQGNYVPCCVEIIQTGPMPAANSFDADPGMTVRLTGGTANRLIFFANPVQPPGSGSVFAGASSKFGDLELVDGVDSLYSVVPVAGTTTITGGSLHDGTLAAVGLLTVLPGVAELNVASLYTGGGIDYQAPGATYNVNETFFFGGDSVPVLPYQWLRVGFAAVALTGDLTVDRVTLGGQGEGPGDSYPGQLTLNGHTLTTTGDVNITGFGTIAMDQPADSFDVGGTIDIGTYGPSTPSAGTLVARGDMYLTGNAIAATGTHKVIFAAPTSQQLWLTAPHDNTIQLQDVTVLAGTTVNFNAFQVGTLNVAGEFWVNGYFQQASSGQEVVVHGDLYAGAAASFVVDTVELHADLEIDASFYSTQLTRYAGAGQVIATNVTYNDVEVTGSAALGANTSVNHDFQVAKSGQLTIGAFTLAVPATFRTLDSGTVVMADPVSEIDADTAFFAGASTAGLLSAGTLRTRALIQDNTTSDLSYFANGTHVTQIGTPLGGSEYRIQMATGDLSRSRIKHLLLADGGVGSVPTRIVGRVTVVGKLTTVSEGSGGIIGDPGAFLSVNDSLIVQDPATDIAIDTLELYGGLQIPNNTLASGVVRFMIGGQVIPDSQTYAGIEVWGNVGVEPAVIAQRVRVLNNGRITINSGQGLAANVVRTEQLGTLEMAGPTAQLQVLDTLVMAGGSTAGLLRQGFLTLSGDLVQSDVTSPQSFAVDSQMYTFFTDPAGQVVTLASPGNAGSHFGFVNLQPNAVVSINASGTVPVWGEMNIQNGANLGSNAGIDVAQNMVSGSGSMVTAPLFIFRTGSAPDGTTTWNVGRTVIAGADTINVPQVNYLGDLEIWTTGRFVYPTTIGGTLRVGGNGTPAYGGWSVATVTANGLDIVDNSRIGMTNTDDSLIVNGTAHFDGGYLADQLTAGTIIFGGDVVQDSTFLTQSFGASATQLVFTPNVTHKLTFASPDNSPWPYMTTGALGGELNINIVGRVVVAGGGLSGNGLHISGDTLENHGPLDAGSSSLYLNLVMYQGPTMPQFTNVSVWSTATTHFTVGGQLPYNTDFSFDTLIVSDSVYGQLSQSLSASYVEVTGPGNPRHVGDNSGYLFLDGGDGNTQLNVLGNVVVRGAGAAIASYSGNLMASGDLIVDQGAYLRSMGSFGGADWSVDGNVTFDGASTRDSLTAGHLKVGKDFIQKGTTSGESFAANPGFVVEFVGAGTHAVDFETPTVAGGGGSYFGSLAFEPVEDIVIKTATDLFVEGTLTTAGYTNLLLQNTAPVLRTLTAREVSIQGITFDHLQFHLENFATPSTANIDIVKFQNFLTDEFQFLVTLPGQAAGGYSFSNFTFRQLDLGGGDTGRYVVATDTDGLSPFLGVSIGTSQSTSGELGYYEGFGGATVSPFSP
jgi:hypothetical protein